MLQYQTERFVRKLRSRLNLPQEFSLPSINKPKTQKIRDLYLPECENFKME